MEAALDGSTLDDLENSLQQTEGGFEAAQSRMDAVRASLKYLDMVGDGSGQELCPTCDTGFQPGELVALLQTLNSSGDNETEELLRRRDGFREQILACKQFSEQTETCEAHIASQQEGIDHEPRIWRDRIWFIVSGHARLTAGLLRKCFVRATGT